MKKNSKYSELHPMKVQVKAGSYAERYYRGALGLPGVRLPMPKAIAPGVAPSPIHDLMFHGGKTVPQMQFLNLYVGGAAAWKEEDMASIDKAISAAMTDKRLNNVIVQYFPGKTISCEFVEAKILPGNPPAVASQGDVEKLLKTLHATATLGKADRETTIFNFILPRGTVLNTDPSVTGNLSASNGQKVQKTVQRAADSLHGLGGYHGSVHTTSQGKKATLYYSVDVFSETMANGRENGIAVFDRPWKNVVATLYHELNEFRTDADVDDAIAAGNDPAGTNFLGWTSRQGEEIGDRPVFAADPLTQVFKQIKLTGKTTTVPIQFQYSNFVHGPEGPIKNPHK
jgi:hypothetical protein